MPPCKCFMALGGCPVDELKARVAALEQLCDHRLEQLERAGGPEPAAGCGDCVHDANSRTVATWVSSTSDPVPHTLEQQRDSRAAFKCDGCDHKCRIEADSHSWPKVCPWQRDANWQDDSRAAPEQAAAPQPECAAFNEDTASCRDCGEACIGPAYCSEYRPSPQPRSCFTCRFNLTGDAACQLCSPMEGDQYQHWQPRSRGGVE